MRPFGSSVPWLCLLLVSCGQRLGAGPELLEVSPNVVTSDQAAVTVQVRGVGFRPRGQANLDLAGLGTVNPTFALELQRLPMRMSLENVQWLSPTLLSADVPPNTPVGLYDLVLTDPWGRTADLPKALQVIDASGGGGDSGTDAGLRDGGADGGARDAGLPDGGSRDGGQGDSGVTDAGARDGGGTDSGAVDSGAVDSGAVDSGAGDSGTFCFSAVRTTLHVDPVTGTDQLGSGTALLPFKTVTYALSSAWVLPGTTLLVHGGVLEAADAGGGERFPIPVPKDIHIQGDARMALPVVHPSYGGSAFVMAAPCSRLANFTIDGQLRATHGVLALAGSAFSTTVEGITVRAMREAGIQVQDGLGADAGARLSLGGGILSEFNGSPASPKSGLLIQNTSRAILNVDVWPPSSFSNNTDFGILVKDLGALQIMSQFDPADGGLVLANGNQAGGLAVVQSPGGPPCEVDGLTASGNAGDGVLLYAGSQVRLRNSVALGNARGIRVTLNVATGDDLSGLDLGVPGDIGGNTLQSLLTPNTGAALCAELDLSNQTLSAEGNIFGGADCGGPDGGLLTRAPQCDGGVDVGSTGATVFDLTSCR